MSRGEEHSGDTGRTGHDGSVVSAPSLRVTLTPDRLRLAAGGSTSVEVTVQNLDTRVQHLALRVEGLPDGATYDPRPPLLKLHPGETGAAVVTVTLPDPPPRAGASTLGLVCASTHDPRVTACEELWLTVQPAPGLAAAFEPELVRTRREGRFTGTLTNAGNTDLTVTVRAQDPEDRLRLRVEPPEVTLPPGARGHVVLTAVAPVLWTGQDRRHALKVTAGADDATAETELAFVQRARVPAGALRLVAGTVGIAAIAAAVVGGLALRRGADAAPDPAASTVATSGAATSPAATEDPTPTPTAPAAPTTDPATAAAAPTPEPTPTVAAGGPADGDVPAGPRTAMFDTLPPGPVPGTFDGLRVSVRADDEACAATTGLVAQESDGGVVLAPAASSEDCVGTPLLVLFGSPADDVVLHVTDDDRTYRLQVEDGGGTTRVHVVQATGGELPVPGARQAGVRSVEVRHTGAQPGTPLALSGVTWEDAPG